MKLLIKKEREKEMKKLDLPHKPAEYLCPVNGLADIYEWKKGERIPEELMHRVSRGFMLLRNEQNRLPQQIRLATGTIGKEQYEFWKTFMDYKIWHGEDKDFTETLDEVKVLINREIPVILFGLDMYHLPYHQKFYQHMHIPGHIVLMVGYDDEGVLIHDNDKEDVQRINYENLKLAWQESYLDLSKRNAYYGIEMQPTEKEPKEIMAAVLRQMAQAYLEPPLDFIGIKGIEKLRREMPAWTETYSKETMKGIYSDFITFTGSVLPGLPEPLAPLVPGLINPHQAGRDRLARALLTYEEILGNESWGKAAQLFIRSGEKIEGLVNLFVEAICKEDYSNTPDIIEKLQEISAIEKLAYQTFL